MPRIHKLSVVPTVADYVSGFAGLRSRMSEDHLAILRHQYQAPSRTATATQLATGANIRGGHTTVNARYGRLGHMLADEMGFVPDQREIGTYRYWAVLSLGWSLGRGRFIWQMLPEVAEALEVLGWVAPGGEPLPEEVRLTRRFTEGAVCRVVVNAYERSPAAREACIAHYGTTCFVCGFSFGATYGELGAGFIHVHHLRPLAEVGVEYTVDPIEDLRPVCANCHCMLHRHPDLPCTIEELRRLLAKSPVA